MLHLNLFQVVNCINVFASANINYLFERIFSPENAKKLSLNLCYTSTCIKTVYTIHHQPGIMQHCRGGEELLQWISSLCCSRWSISWWEDALIAHVGETRAIVMFAKSLWYQQFSIKARAGKWEIRFWISSGPSGSFDALRLRPRTKTKLQASDTWESWGLNDEMHFSTSIIPNAKMFLLLRNITSYCNFCNWAYWSSGGVGWDTGGDSQQFGWFANKAGDWDSVTSKMLRTSQ